MGASQTPGEEPAHDVLAAEAFAVPAPDPVLHHHGPVLLPDDPTGDPEPHDVLAAEEFAMPAPRPGGWAGRSRQESSRRLAVAAAVLSALAVAALRRRRS